MLSCWFYNKRILALADNQLDPAAAGRVQRHIAACPDCKKLYDHFVSTRPVAAIADPAAAIKPEQWEQQAATIVRKLQQQTAPLAAPRRWNLVPLATVGALACICLIGIFVMLGPQVSRMFKHTVNESNVGEGQAALSAAVY